MDFPDCKYDHQAVDFQDEAIWDVIWLADKWATGPWDGTHLGFRCITSQFAIKYDITQKRNFCSDVMEAALFTFDNKL